MSAGRRHGNEAQGLRDHGIVPEGQGGIHGAEDLEIRVSGFRASGLRLHGLLLTPVF